MISGFLHVSLSPRTNSFYPLGDQDTSKKTGNPTSLLEHIMFGNLKTEHVFFESLGKGGHRKIMKVRLHIS